MATREKNEKTQTASDEDKSVTPDSSPDVVAGMQTTALAPGDMDFDPVTVVLIHHYTHEGKGMSPETTLELDPVTAAKLIAGYYARAG